MPILEFDRVRGLQDYFQLQPALQSSVVPVYTDSGIVTVNKLLIRMTFPVLAPYTFMYFDWSGSSDNSEMPNMFDAIILPDSSEGAVSTAVDIAGMGYGYVTPADLSTCAELLLRLGLDRGALDALSPPGSQSSQPQLDTSSQPQLDTSSQEPPSKRKKQAAGGDDIEDVDDMEAVDNVEEADESEKSQDRPGRRPCRGCPICGERFENKNMKRHMEEVHGNRKEEPCPLCGQVYQRKEDKDKHQCKRDPELFPFQCGECFTRVKTEEKLKNHHKYKSKVCFRFQCESCDTKFSSTKSYYTHNRTVHEVELGGLEEEEVFVVIVPNNGDENINLQLEEATVGVQEM